MRSQPRVHPSALPTLVLISLLANCKIHQLILDQILELSFSCIYEDTPPVSLKLWLRRVSSVESSQHSQKLAGDIEDIVSSLVWS